VEQELLTLPAHLSLPPTLSGVRVTQSLVLEQTTQWPKEKDKQRSTKHIYKTKNRVTRTSQKTGFPEGHAFPPPLVAPAVLSHELGKDHKVFTTS
jgi:hypothetical protein